MEQKISMMDTLTIRTAAPFKNLFPIRENLLDEIAADMKQNGYDFAHPIIIWARRLLPGPDFSGGTDRCRTPCGIS